jgi:DNA-binding PadR family transcriptional regulator
MSTTRLLVLGAVKLFQPVHGYDVRRELLTWDVQNWAHVQPGSIYHHLRTLERDRMLAVVGVDQAGGRPARTSYELTEDGEAMFQVLLRDALWRVTGRPEDLMAALCFLPNVGRDEAIAALESRINQINDAIRSVGFWSPEHYKPAHVSEVYRLSKARLSAEADWAGDLIERLRSGEYTMAGEKYFEENNQT